MERKRELACVTIPTREKEHRFELGFSGHLDTVDVVVLLLNRS